MSDISPENSQGSTAGETELDAQRRAEYLESLEDGRDDNSAGWARTRRDDDSQNPHEAHIGGINTGAHNTDSPATPWAVTTRRRPRNRTQGDATELELTPDTSGVPERLSDEARATALRCLATAKEASKSSRPDDGRPFKRSTDALSMPLDKPTTPRPSELVERAKELTDSTGTAHSVVFQHGHWAIVKVGS